MLQFISVMSTVQFLTFDKHMHNEHWIIPVHVPDVTMFLSLSRLQRVVEFPTFNKRDQFYNH